MSHEISLSTFCRRPAVVRGSRGVVGRPRPTPEQLVGEVRPSRGEGTRRKSTRRDTEHKINFCFRVSVGEAAVVLTDAQPAPTAHRPPAGTTRKPRIRERGTVPKRRRR